MSQTSALAALAAICEGFFDVERARRCVEIIEPGALPPRARELLAHEDHMTLVLQRHYGEPVRLEVLERGHQGDTYARKIVLRPMSRDTVVEVGVVRIDLSTLDEATRAKIIEARTPLGEVLITHDVMRRIEPRHYFRFSKGSPILECFGLPPVDEAFGRVGVIHCNGSEGVQLLEVVRP